MEEKCTIQGLHDSRRRMARVLFTTFVLTFLTARIIVLLIMTHRLPDLFLHLGGTHVHHMNYGIVLLAASGAYLLFLRPLGRSTTVVAVVYSIGLALTFDEFGMWLHLGGSYWQRASFDAVIVVAGILALIAFSPPIRSLRPKHAVVVAVILIAGAVFSRLLVETIHTAERNIAPTLHRVEESGPK